MEQQTNPHHHRIESNFRVRDRFGIQIRESTGSKTHLEPQTQFLCACGNKLKCEGVCRETHLYRKRKDGKRCPAAYNN